MDQALAGYFLSHWWATFWVSIVASILAVIFALVCAFLAVGNRIVGSGLGLIAAGSQSFPLQAIAPLILLAFGTGDLVKVAICFFIAFFPIFGTLQGAIASSQNALQPFLKVTGNQSASFRYRLTIQHALPSILAACKVGFTLSVMGAVVSEFILPQQGLGYVIVLNLSQIQYGNVLIAIALLIAQGIVAFSILSWLERRELTRRGEL
jgi:NitT/TauT family transport system permease protein